jgi:hypothetical protein
VSYTVTNNTDAPIVAHVRCTIYDATGAPISARSVWTPVKPHDTSVVDSVAFFQTPPMLTKVERFDCVVERVSTDPTTSNNWYGRGWASPLCSSLALIELLQSLW